MKKKQNLVSKVFVKLLGNEKHQFITIPIFAIAISLIVGGIVIGVLGKNPLSAYVNLLQGPGLVPKGNYANGRNTLTDFFSFMDSWTPMIFASLAVAVAMKAGLFNIGVSGQMLSAGFITTIVVGYSSLSASIAKPLVIVIAAVIGALIGGLIGFLKYKFNINEVVSSIMFDYIAQYIISFFINIKYINPVSRQSEVVSDASRLTLSGIKIGGLKFDIPLGFILAVVAVLTIKFLFDKTKVGFELKAIGANQNASRYAGINVGRNIVLVMVISGALAGLAGATYYMGYFASIQPRVLSSVGYDAIAVSILGNSHPIGILCSSFLINIVGKGSTYMSSTAGLDAETATVITGLILLFAACSEYIKYCVKRTKDRTENENEGREAV